MKNTAGTVGLSSETAQGRAWGTFFFTGFGTLWLLTGLANMHRFTLVRGALIVFTGLATFAGGVALLQMSKRLPSDPLPPTEEARVQRVFNAVNIIQWVAVATASVVLSLLHLQEYIIPAIGIVVGLHLYPLAEAFRHPLHAVTGTVLVAWCAVCIVLLPKARVPGLGAFGTGAVLLASAAVTLIVAFSRARVKVEVPAAANLLAR